MTIIAPTSSRLGARVLAVLVALLAISFAHTSALALDSAWRHGETSAVIGAAIALVVCCALALSEGWYAWRGWARATESRVSRVIRWSCAGLVLWGLLGTAVIVALTAIFSARDAGMLPALAWLTAPFGAILGAVLAGRRREGE